MKRFSLLVVAFTLGLWLLAPSPGSADCYCVPGGGTTIWQTTWGGAPTYTCNDLAAIGYNGANQYAANQCPYGVCVLLYNYQSCEDQGLETQHYDLYYWFKCNVCDN